ncbi:myeloid-associated differentiation marker-like [Hyla sarda]|uniref:myeloid-associated differentiation marker-like n=1 Tax=Hyla sarda TaxID=327740 RepID=UPI0024C25226|nr:myeloid-associated differentiation marker-like [Hyla sarda]
MNVRNLISPLVIIRFFEIFLSCTAFSLVASADSYHNQFGAWSMFTWILSFIVTILIVVLELTGFYSAIPISWEDFTSFFSMLASLMLFTTSIMYPSIFLQGGCSGYICACRGAATAMSILGFIAYSMEVGLTRAKPGEISGFLSTIPGLLKVFEAYVACIIFSLLPTGLSGHPGLQWSVAVYSICFIITVLIIILTIGRLLAKLPMNIEKFLIGFNILAVAMYLTVVVVWPLYFFRLFPNRNGCVSVCPYDIGVGITILTCINLIAYIVDLVYSVKMVFFVVQA